MLAIAFGVILLIGAAALWHYGDRSPPLLIAVVALAIVGAFLLVIGLVAVADRANVESAGALTGALKASKKRALRLEKQATGLRASRRRAVRGGAPRIPPRPRY